MLCCDKTLIKQKSFCLCIIFLFDLLVFELISKTVLLTFLVSDFYPLLVECLVIRREQQQLTNPTGELALSHDCFMLKPWDSHFMLRLDDATQFNRRNIEEMGKPNLICASHCSKHKFFVCD